MDSPLLIFSHETAVSLHIRTEDRSEFAHKFFSNGFCNWGGIHRITKKFTDRTHNGSDISEPRRMETSFQLDELTAWDGRRNLSPQFKRDHPVSPAVHHQGRNAYLRKGISYIKLISEIL